MGRIDLIDPERDEDRYYPDEGPRIEQVIRWDGPCYDLCMCSRCWRGWTGMSLWERVKHRIVYIWNGVWADG